MADINQNIATNLRRLLAERDKNQSDLANYLGVSQATVSFWCKGQKVPRMDKLDRICSFLGCTRSDLMEPPRTYPTNEPPITGAEYALILAFRRCDRARQDIIRELLGLKPLHGTDFKE